MIGKGAEISISTNGDSIPVEYIKAGDYLLCGMTDDPVMVRRIERVEYGNKIYNNFTAPVLIRSRSIFGQAPRSHIIISGNYECLVGKYLSRSDPIELVEAKTHDLGLEVNDPYYICGKFPYFCLSLERAAYVDLSGLLVRIPSSTARRISY